MCNYSNLLRSEFFSTVNTTVPHDPQLFEFMDVEPFHGKNMYKESQFYVTFKFSTPGRSDPNSYFVQGSIIFSYSSCVMSQKFYYVTETYAFVSQ